MTTLHEMLDLAEDISGLLADLQRDPPPGLAPATLQLVADAVEGLDVALADAWDEAQRAAECSCSGGYGNDPGGVRRSPTCPVHGRDPDQARDMREVA